MFLLAKPSASDIARFLSDSADLPFSYEPIGLATDGARGFRLDTTRATLGHGEACFETAKAALRQWKHFDLGWVELSPKRTPTTPGAVVAVLIHHLGFWSLNGCRVAYAVAPAGQNIWGFAYGTLSNHAETGEELFTISRDPGTDEVTYEIRAASRPRAPLARIGYPVTRSLQARFRRDSVAVMRRAVTALS